MNLFILTLADGSPVADKCAALVAGLADATPVTDAGNLVLGDAEPLTLKFTTGSAAAAFSGDSTYSLAVALGELTSSGVSNLSSTTAFTAVSGGWTGRLALDTTALVNHVHAAHRRGQPGALLYLQVRVTDPSGYPVTYALVPVMVLFRVLPGAAVDSTIVYLTLAQLQALFPQIRADIASLTGGGATALDGIATASGAMATGAIVLLGYGRAAQLWQLVAGTDAEDPSAGVVRPDDYHASTNARIWVQL